MPKPANNSDSMEQVRELLLGSQLKDMESQFQRQQEHFLRELSDLRESMKNRLESLENFMKSESASLLRRLQEEQAERGAALKNEQRERTESLAQLTKDLTSQEENFERKLAALSGALDAAEHELRQLLQAESARLSDKVEEKYKDALDVLAKTADQIRHDMVYRSSLAGLFTEMAVKLTGQWTMSDSLDYLRSPESSADAHSESADNDKPASGS